MIINVKFNYFFSGFDIQSILPLTKINEFTKDSTIYMKSVEDYFPNLTEWCDNTQQQMILYFTIQQLSEHTEGGMGIVFFESKVLYYSEITFLRSLIRHQPLELKHSCREAADLICPHFSDSMFISAKSYLFGKLQKCQLRGCSAQREVQACPFSWKLKMVVDLFCKMILKMANEAPSIQKWLDCKIAQNIKTGKQLCEWWIHTIALALPNHIHGFLE